MTKIASLLVVSLMSLLFSSSFGFSVTTQRSTFHSQRYDATLLRLSDEPSAEAPEEAPPGPPVKCPDCDMCDGSGRILGGLGAILPWLPVKAYRPCPNLVERGGFYSRTGQGLDEIAFGRDSTFKPGDN
jgi:hypothetical protein